MDEKRRWMQFNRSKYLSFYTQVRSTVMCIGSDLYPEKRYFDSSLGKIVSAKGNLFYKMDDLDFNCGDGGEAMEMTKRELADLFFKGGMRGRVNRAKFLNNGLLNISWVRFSLIF